MSRVDMAIDPKLLAVYRATHYEVNWDRGAFVLRIDQRSGSLAACHRAFGVSCSAFITAWNPRSQPADDASNAAAQDRLQARLHNEGYRTVAGVGEDPTGAWPAEHSLLVLGMNAADAQRVGRAFDQSAVVVAGTDAVPRLLWVADGQSPV
jgi:hypothetical protein